MKTVRKAIVGIAETAALIAKRWYESTGTEKSFAQEFYKKYADQISGWPGVATAIADLAYDVEHYMDWGSVEFLDFIGTLHSVYERRSIGGEDLEENVTTHGFRERVIMAAEAEYKKRRSNSPGV